MSKTRIKINTLNKKKRFWQNLIGLRDWKIEIKFASITELEQESDMKNEIILALLKICEPIEKVAVILFRDDYYNDENFGITWNIDTLLLHEFFHIIMCQYVEDLSDKIQNNAKFKKLEEFVCDKMANIVYKLSKKSKK